MSDSHSVSVDMPSIVPVDKLLDAIPINTPPKYIHYNILSLSTPNKDGKNTVLSWGYRGLYPRITVYFNCDDRKSYENMLVAPMDNHVFYMLLYLLEYIGKADNNTAYTLNCYHVRWVDDQPTDEKYLKATVTVGKDEKGICYIEVAGDGYPTARFNLMPSEWHSLVDGQGNPISPDKVSKLYAASYARLLIDFFGNVITKAGLADADTFIPKKRNTNTQSETQ